MKYCLHFSLIIALLICTFSTAEELSTEDRIRQLEKLVEKQQKRIEEMQTQMETSDEKTKEYTEQIVQEYLGKQDVEEEWGIQAGFNPYSDPKHGFFIRSADGEFEFILSGFMLAGVGLFENDTNDNNGFFLNGIFLNFDVYFYSQWHARLQVDFSGTRGGAPNANNQGGVFQNNVAFEPRLRDAYVEYIGIPELNIRVGQGFVPFTIAGQYLENEAITILSEPFITSWSHGRDIGLTIIGLVADSLEYRFGIYNGEGQNNFNQTDDPTFAGQLRYFFFGHSNNRNSFVHLGFLAGRDNRDKGRATGNNFGSTALFTPWGRQLFGDFDANGRGGNDDDAKGWRVAADAGFKVNYGNLRFEGEFMFSSWERNAFEGENVDLRDSIGYAGFLGASYKINLTGEDDGSGLTPGLVVSYADIDDDGDSNQELGFAGQTVVSYTLVLGYSFNENVNVAVNWILVNADRSNVRSPKENGEVDGTEQAVFVQFGAQF